MRRRLLGIGLLIVLNVLVLLGAGVSATETPECEGYVVNADQTLTMIAADYGIPVELLARYNQLDVTAELKAGQVIWVPIITQVAPQLAGTADSAPAATPAGDVITGVVGTITAPKTDILRRPAPGQALFSNVVRGTRLLVIGQTGGYYAVLMSDGTTGFVPQIAVALSETRMQVPRPTPAPTDGQSKYIDTAMEYLGVPYQYGGRLPNTVDCSLLVQTVFARHGVKLPRTAAQQYGVGTPVEVANLQPGDRLYFTNSSGAIGHTGLYIGGGRFIHASSNRGRVAVDELATPAYWRKFAGARR
jgi:cell wall-associated NlpC family hydrolase